MKTSMPSAVNNSDLIQEVLPFWYSLKDKNTIADLYTPANPSIPMSTPLSTLESVGYKIIPTITDGTAIDPKTGKYVPMVLSNLLADPVSRAKVVNTIVNLVMSNKFDGIDLDFENFAFVDPNSSWPTTQIRWVQFISDLSTALHAQGKILSITTPPLFDPSSGKKGYYLFAWSQVGQFIDQLHIMAYDYSTSSPGPIGPIQWTTNAVTYAISVMPASKVYIGIPGYGRDWVTSVSGTCPSQPVNYLKTVAPGVVSTFVMHDVAGLATTYGATPTFDTNNGESTFKYQKVYNGTTANGSLTTCTASRTVWYQDAQAFTLRANLVAQYRLGGISEWTLGMEDPTAMQAVRSVAQSIAPDAVAAQIVSNASAVTIGSAINLTGTFTLPDKSPIVGIPVHLQTQNSDGVWTNLSDGVSASDGTYSASLILGENTGVKMTTDATWERLAGQTPTLVISVARAISWSIPATMKRGTTYSISGQIQPKIPGVTMTLSNGATATTDANGNFTFSVTNTLPGFIKYQVTANPDKRFVASQTNIVTVWVR